MYIFKNALTNISRSIGRNLLIGSIITCVTIASCITITINKSGHTLIKSYKDSNPLKVTLNLDPMSFRNANEEEKDNFKLLDLETINKIGELKEVVGYYYTSQTGLNEDAISPISYENLFTRPDDDARFNTPEKKGGMNKQIANGDFTIKAYSDISYNEDFINGTKKIVEGAMIDNSYSDGSIIISEELALENALEVGNKITFKDINNEEIIYEFEIVGIYETSSTTDTNLSVASSSNDILTTMQTVNNIKKNDTTSSDYSKSSNISSVFYLENEDLEEFSKNVREMNVSEYYQILTNEEEILESLKPIENIASFSFTFLIVVLIVGGLVLTIINLFNIRERKYEIGVLRAIGMTKIKLTLQLVSEILVIAIISLLLGTGVGALLTQPVGNMMLASEIENINTENNQINENFGAKPGDSSDRNYQRPAFNKGQNNNIDYVDTLKVNVDIMTFLQLFFVSIILTIISGTVAIMFVNKYEPNKILQNRN